MKREIITTADGSKTIHIPEWNEQYHSKHGAIQEARHVFLKTGLLHYVNKFPIAQLITILEIGFGTGLNALLTFYKAKELGVSVEYTGIEAFPVSPEEVVAMGYASEIKEEGALKIYNALHSVRWEEQVAVSNTFELTKRKQDFKEIIDQERYDLIFFDAFGPRVQPGLWTREMFIKMYTSLKVGGVLTTYCAQGAARRAMQEAGFVVERLPGPPGKREMLRASKPITENSVFYNTTS